MTKAIKKEEVKPEVETVAPRQAQCEKELLEVLEKNGYRLNVELAYTPQAIVPRLVLADITPPVEEAETNDTKETDKPELKKD